MIRTHPALPVFGSIITYTAREMALGRSSGAYSNLPTISTRCRSRSILSSSNHRAEYDYDHDHTIQTLVSPSPPCWQIALLGIVLAFKVSESTHRVHGLHLHPSPQSRLRHGPEQMMIKRTRIMHPKHDDYEK
jgi:hypothetical protein